MAQRFDQPPAQSEPPVKFTFNEKNPSQSYLCEDNFCKQVSPSEFKAGHPQEYADYLKMHPEYKQRMEEFDKSNPAIRSLPLTAIDGLVDRKPGPRVKLRETDGATGEADVRIPLVLDPQLKGKRDGLVIPLLKDGELPLQLEPRDSSIRQLPLDSTKWQYRLDPNSRSLKLDPSGRLQFDEGNELQFDPSRRLQFDKDGRIQLRVRPDGSDVRGYNPDDPLSLLRGPLDRDGMQGRYGRDSFERRNPLEDLLDPFGRNRRLDALDPFGRNRQQDLLDPFGRRNSPLDALLDPFGQRRGDLNGQYLNIPPLDSRLRLPGQQPNNTPYRLDSDLSPQQLNDLYQKGGLKALPPAVREQVLQQLMTGEVQVVPKVEPPQPVEPVVKPLEKQPEKQPVTPPEKAPEKPVAEVPAKPVDGPKPPTDLEKPTDASPDAKDKTEQLDAFGQAIKDTGAFTIDNFSQAYKEAAAAGSGVAIMVVGRGIPGSEEAIKNVKKLQEENPKLKFLIVDRDKVDAAIKADPNNAKMQEWKTWIDNSLKACGGSEKNTVLTSVQSLKADSSGYPAPEKVTSFHWNSNINQELATKASLASDATASHAKEFRLSMDATSANALKDQIKAAREDALATPIDGFAGLKARQEKFVKALQAASQARPDLLAQRRKEIDALKDETKRKEELATLWELENAPRLLRAELGLDMVRSVADMAKPEKKAAMMEAGMDVLKDAYRAAPELKGNAEFAAALKAAGVNVDQLIKDSEKSPPVSADQIKQKLEKAYTAGDPVQVTEKNTAYRGNLTPEMRACVKGGCCYNNSCIREKCCTPGGICRNLCRRCR
ncbi:MAG TPA: hypothetical protein EYN91_13310 [Candidatus Melainabacteria bacterium]|nr:hypothetical protein [Candidatus Melainabacteria bacterium]